MRQPIRAVATAAVAILIFSACSSGATPSPSGGGASPSGVSAPVSAPASAPASTSAFDPKSITGTVVLSGWQSTGAEGDALNATLDCVQDGVSEHHPRLPADRDRLPDGDGREVQLRRAAGPVLRRLERRARLDRPGRPPGARHDGRGAGLRHEPVLSRLSRRVQGSRRQDLRLPEGRQHARHGVQHRHADRGRRHAADELDRARGGRRQAHDRQPEGVLPEPHARPGARVHLPERRLAVQRRQEDEHRRFARDRRGDQDLSRLLQERPGRAAPPISATTGAARPSARRRSR